MRKQIIGLAGAIALIGLVFIPSVAATPPTAAYGTWCWSAASSVDKVAGGNFFRSGSETAVWTGTFDGTSFDTFTMVVYRSSMVTGKVTVYFEGSVDGRAGTMVIEIFGMITDVYEGGSWVIKSGTGALAGLHGEGKWWAQPWTTDSEYEGKIHWE